MLLHPHFIKFEKPENRLSLSFSAVAKKEDRKRISDIQKEIKKIVKKEEMLKDLGIEEEREGLYKRIKRGDRFIYKYPPESLHFSIVNFATYDTGKNAVSLRDFDDVRKNIEDTANFEKLRANIEIFKGSFLREVLENNEFIDVQIGRIYLPAGIEGSLALNAFPKTKCFFTNLGKIVEETRKRMDTEKLPVSHNLKIKAYSEKNYQYFALNIFRFIDRDENHFNQGGTFYKKVEKINSSGKFPFKLKMKPCIVISDPYLANDEPAKIDC